jgi:hypothetical protein
MREGEMKKLWWRMPIFVVIWILFLVLKLATAVVGLVAVPFLFAYRDIMYDGLPSWTRPWANPEDWYGGPKTYEKTSLPKWWVDKHGPTEWSFFRYHAIRNPANGLRSFELLDLDIDMAKVQWVGTKKNPKGDPHEHYEPSWMRKNWPTEKTFWYICWQGFQAGVKIVHIWNNKRHFVFKFGWRIQPQDATTSIDPSDIRFDDAGFATKLLPYRKG